jgi:hypothetical protein
VVGSDNPSGAVNQQERSSSAAWLDAIPHDIGHYIAGFVDGEGSFNVPIRRSRDRGLPFRVSLSFNVSQVGEEAPRLLQSVFGVGTTRGRRDGDLAVFRQIATMVRTGRHLSIDGFIDILALRGLMNQWWQAPAYRRRTRQCVEELGILRGHTQGSPVEARG